MIKLKITKLQKEEAYKHSKERMRYEYDRLGLSDEKRQSMIQIGTIGQLVFKGFLESKNVNFNFEFQAGNYDNMDFMLNNDIIEIKTSGYDDSFIALNLLYSKDQFQAGLRKGFKYCVQIFINGYSRTLKMLDMDKCDTAVIAGYIEFEKIADFPNNKKFFGDDFKIPLSNLKDIELLVKK
jgi:hypothetical protein